jgi:hypothetical protein
MEDNVTVVPRPFEPDETRKKGLRKPHETVELAKSHPDEAVMHSVGHTSENAARSAVKRIHSGQFSAWREFHGKLHAYVIPYDDGSYGVAVTWTGGVER